MCVLFDFADFLLPRGCNFVFFRAQKTRQLAGLPLGLREFAWAHAHLHGVL